jgi:hypothetical protein
MSLRDEIVLDSIGCPTPADTTTTLSDNGSLFLSEYILLLKRRNEIRYHDISEFNKKIEQFINGGNLQRYPGDTSDSCPDNVIGVASACRQFYPIGAKLIYTHGQCQQAVYLPEYESPSRRKWSSLIFPILQLFTLNRVRWVYNLRGPSLYNPAFTLSNWLGRQPGLIGYIAYCAGQKVSPFQHLSMTLGLLLTMWEGKNPRGEWESSDRILGYLMLEQLSETYPFYKWLNNLYIKNINKRFGSVNKLIATYFGPQHAFTKYWEF